MLMRYCNHLISLLHRLRYQMLQGCLLSLEHVLNHTHPIPQLIMTHIQSTDQILQSDGERIIRASSSSLWPRVILFLVEDDII